MQVTDPQCANVASSLTTLCTQNVHALALISGFDANGKAIAGPIVLQHAAPGTRGNFDTDTIYGPGRWGADMNLGKSIEFMEGKSLTLRIDAQNIFNHPTPSGTLPSSYNNRQYSLGNPNFDLGSTTLGFGQIPYKGGHRVFSAKVKLNF